MARLALGWFAQVECPVCLEPFGDRPSEVQGCQLHKLCVDCASSWRASCNDELQAALCPVCRGGAEFQVLRSARHLSPRAIERPVVDMSA